MKAQTLLNKRLKRYEALISTMESDLTKVKNLVNDCQGTNKFENLVHARAAIQSIKVSIDFAFPAL